MSLRFYVVFCLQKYVSPSNISAFGLSERCRRSRREPKVMQKQDRASRLRVLSHLLKTSCYSHFDNRGGYDRREVDKRTGF
ncbi:hypothetical protein HBI56_176330 [Parastagonospora nodorum]|uniref:Uncharacterized protein n=1 Tax=Phaeosphaeria nodorum (strain SN15 / ATCC MYA-4574 / FGSC 10173) TaxID=321614 RepID=A0A7U2I7Z6_PHANO|nr:hypothetical protein HBH56_237470 [Parastagonospora nodorum]QRD03862.1 hypothetical protein JI435_420420 [Parastagonospora nodorum SN15]KAH3924349.1 hypothetical protein HBH54_197690 [Parastagonospora nodorum]KAH3942399.1 hypothetical protein HBH53_185800 [Parastagonospora nodorum]KAH3961596.1 hypothetical protein HBH51_181040 [Parastagonospora nodorum]